jgi:AmmeMemoRadiSam system protein A
MAVGSLAAHLVGRTYRIRPPGSVVLGRPGASFVTLESGGALRGCVGTVEPVRPLWRDVVHNAVRAAADPRLPAVIGSEWPTLDITVSILSRPERIPADDGAGLAAALRPGVDGLLLSDGARRAIFLPAVWDKLADPERFVAALLAKGGWPTGAWPSALTAHRYTATHFSDRPPRPTLAGHA